MDKGAKAIGFNALVPKEIKGDHPEDVCVVASLRGEPSSYNAYNLILEQLARGMGNSKSSCDIRIRTARHGDFMSADEKDPTVGVTGAVGTVMQCVGLFSNSRVRSDIQHLILGFLQSVLGINPAAYAQKIEEMKLANTLTEEHVDGSLPSRRDQLPRFLQ
jgi:hypothetical protein